jgi:hypothetical protein
LEELKMRMDESENRKRAADEQMELMERSLQMASKYMPANPANNTGATLPGTSAANPEPAENGNNNSNVSGKTAVVPVGLVVTQTVSALHQNISDADFIEAFSKPRKM